MRDPRCLAYVRVSTDKQANGKEAQIERLTDYHKGLQVAQPGMLPKSLAIYCDFAVSGKTVPFFSRQEGARLKRECSKGDVLIVTKVDRFGRDMLDSLNALDWLRKNGVDAHFLDIGGGVSVQGTNSPVGRMMLHMLMAFAQMDGEKISERTKEALASRRNRGLRTCFSRYGKKFIDDGNGGLLEVDDVEFMGWAKLILRLSQEGFRYAEIAERLNDKKAKTPDTWKDGLWTPARVAKIGARERKAAGLRMLTRNGGS